MDLRDCGAYFFDSGGRKGVGLIFECPTCIAEGSKEPYLIPVHFKNPLDDGGPCINQPSWQRTGDMIETLTLFPSIDASKHDHDGHLGWHGHIRGGKIV